jgi:hypothetical protein
VQQTGEGQHEERRPHEDMGRDRRAVDRIAVPVALCRPRSLRVGGRAGTAVQHQREAAGKQRGRQHEPQHPEDQAGDVLQRPPPGPPGGGVDADARDHGRRYQHQAGDVVGMVAQRPAGSSQGPLGE